jgi:hypothetical protein
VSAAVGDNERGSAAVCGVRGSRACMVDCARIVDPTPPTASDRPQTPHPDRSVDYLHRECAAKRVFVLPAFETPRVPDAAAAHKVSGQAVATSKLGLQAMVKRKMVHQVRRGPALVL